MRHKSHKTWKQRSCFRYWFTRVYGQLNNPESAKILLEWFDSQETLDAMKAIPWLEEEIKIYVESKKGLASILGTPYDALQADHDLYEACILWGILENNILWSVESNYQDIAKIFWLNCRTKRYSYKRRRNYRNICKRFFWQYRNLRTSDKNKYFRKWKYYESIYIRISNT